MSDQPPVAAAASLFGEAPSNDFFASTDAQPSEPAPEPTFAPASQSEQQKEAAEEAPKEEAKEQPQAEEAADLFGGTAEPGEASALFGSAGAEEEPLFGVSTDAPSGEDLFSQLTTTTAAAAAAAPDAPAPQSEQAQAQDYPYYPDPASLPSPRSATFAIAEGVVHVPGYGYGWYDEQGTWTYWYPEESLGGGAQSASAQSYDQYAPAASQAQTAPDPYNSQAPYTPSASYASSYAPASATNDQYAPATSTNDPYAPAPEDPYAMAAQAGYAPLPSGSTTPAFPSQLQAAQQAAYTQGQGTSTTPAYEPYAPATLSSSTASAYTPSTYSPAPAAQALPYVPLTSSISAPPSPPKPKPAAHTTEPYHPPAAYDPPPPKPWHKPSYTAFSPKLTAYHPLPTPSTATPPPPTAAQLGPPRRAASAFESQQPLVGPPPKGGPRRVASYAPGEMQQELAAAQQQQQQQQGYQSFSPPPSVSPAYQPLVPVTAGGPPSRATSPYEPPPPAAAGPPPCARPQPATAPPQRPSTLPLSPPHTGRRSASPLEDPYGAPRRDPSIWPSQPGTPTGSAFAPLPDEQMPPQPSWYDGAAAAPALDENRARRVDTGAPAAPSTPLGLPALAVTSASPQEETPSMPRPAGEVEDLVKELQDLQVQPSEQEEPLLPKPAEEGPEQQPVFGEDPEGGAQALFGEDPEAGSQSQALFGEEGALQPTPPPVDEVPLDAEAARAPADDAAPPVTEQYTPSAEQAPPVDPYAPTAPVSQPSSPANTNVYTYAPAAAEPAVPASQPVGPYAPAAPAPTDPYAPPPTSAAASNGYTPSYGMDDTSPFGDASAADATLYGYGSPPAATSQFDLGANGASPVPETRASLDSIAAPPRFQPPAHLTSAAEDPYAPSTPPMQIGSGWQTAPPPQSSPSKPSTGMSSSYGAYQPPSSAPAPYNPYTPVAEPYAPASLSSSPRSIPPRSYTASPHKGYAPGRSSSEYPLRCGTLDHPVRTSSEYSYEPVYGDYAGFAANGAQQPAVLNGPYEVGSGGADEQVDLRRAPYPIVSFGFGGKVVVHFPQGTSSSSSLTDLSSPFASLSAAPAVPSFASPSTVSIRKMADILPPAPAPFPGPVFVPPSGNKGKKKDALQYLDARAKEHEVGLAFVAQGSEEAGKHHEAKIALLRIVKIMVENEGKLSGRPQIEEAVRSALLPKGAGIGSYTTKPPSPVVERFPSAPSPYATNGGIFGSTAPALSDKPQRTVASYEVSSHALDHIQSLLLRGARRDAVRFALDERMWAHALVMSSCVDKETWKEVVDEFVRVEMGSKLDVDGQSNGRESMRVAYSMFAGQGAASIDAFFPPRSLSNMQDALAAPAPMPMALSSPGFKPPPKLTSASLVHWQETAATLISNPDAGDAQATLRALGDTLAANGWIEAGHVCYLLSPKASPLGGEIVPGARIALVGSESPKSAPAFHRNLDSIILTELVEYALSLVPVAKGQEPYHGLPHLQAHRLVHAWRLADLGYLSEAQRYCEAIAGTLKLATRGSPYYHPTLLTQLRELSDRLCGAPQMDKTGSWITRKMVRPSLDTLWTSMEGRLTKFIAGDGDGTSEGEPTLQKASQLTTPKVGKEPVVGPFSHYSSISPASTSGTLSRTPSAVDLNGGLVQGARRTASPFQYGSGGVPPPPARASSAGGYHQRPVALSHMRTPSASGSFSAHAAAGQFADSGSAYNAYQPYGSSSRAASTFEEATPTSNVYPAGLASPYNPEGDSAGWWGAAQGGESSGADQPKAPLFSPISEDEAPAVGEGGFVSLMDGFSSAPTPTFGLSTDAFQSSGSGRAAAEEEDLEDLGFGNASTRARARREEPEEDEAASAAKEEEPKQEVKPRTSSSWLRRSSTGVMPPAAPAASGEDTTKRGEGELKTSASSSWLSRWWKKEPAEAAGSGPVRAKLGEESSFYYDAEQKRWVNKKAGAAAEAPKPPPPPPRAQTTSPSTTGPRLAAATPPAASGSVPPQVSAAGPQPPRAAAGPPPPGGAPPPFRRPPSSLAQSHVPSDAPSEAGTPPPPPPGGARKPAKKNIRSRYVAIE